MTYGTKFLKLIFVVNRLGQRWVTYEKVKYKLKRRVDKVSQNFEKKIKMSNASHLRIFCPSYVGDFRFLVHILGYIFFMFLTKFFSPYLSIRSAMRI